MSCGKKSCSSLRKYFKLYLLENDLLECCNKLLLICRNEVAVSYYVVAEWCSGLPPCFLRPLNQISWIPNVLRNQCGAQSPHFPLWIYPPIRSYNLQSTIGRLIALHAQIHVLHLFKTDIPILQTILLWSTH